MPAEATPAVAACRDDIAATAATCPEFVPAARPAAHLFTQRPASVERRVPGHKPGSQLIVAVTTVSHNSCLVLAEGGRKSLFFNIIPYVYTTLRR